MARDNIQGIPMNNILSFDKLGNGMFKLKLADGSIKDVSLDKGEMISLGHAIRQRSKTDANLTVDDKNSTAPTEELSPSDLEPIRDFSSIERNLNNWMEVEYVDENMGGFWSSDEDLARYLSVGYRHAKPEDIVDFKLRFSDINPGEALSPSGLIARHGLTLLVRSHNLAKKVDDYYLNKSSKIEEREMYISQNELAKKQAQYNV